MKQKLLSPFWRRKILSSQNIIFKIKLWWFFEDKHYLNQFLGCKEKLLEN